MQRAVWINKSTWRKPGPIVYMGLLNANSFALNKIETDYFIGHGDESNTEQDLKEYYGLNISPLLKIHRIKQGVSKKREVYRQAMLKIEQYLNNGDTVIALTRVIGAVAQLLKIKKKHPQLKIVYEAHDYYLSSTHQPKQGPSTFRRQWAERFLLPKVDALICLTEHQRALYQQKFIKTPIIALSLGCLDFPLQDAGPRRLKRNVAYIGHLHSYKGSDFIFDIASTFKSKNIRLFCYGGKEAQVAEFRSKAQQQGLEQILIFKSFISPAELHEILDKEISIGLVPLQDTFYSRYLTCPVKALDFLSHGLPVVASELPSTREVLQYAGNYCSSVEASQFSNNIERLLDSESIFQRSSDDSYKRSIELQWYIRAEKILNFLV